MGQPRHMIRRRQPIRKTRRSGPMPRALASFSRFCCRISFGARLHKTRSGTPCSSVIQTSKSCGVAQLGFFKLQDTKASSGSPNALRSRPSSGCSRTIAPEAFSTPAWILRPFGFLGRSITKNFAGFAVTTAATNPAMPDPQRLGLMLAFSSDVFAANGFAHGVRHLLSGGIAADIRCHYARGTNSFHCTH